jgi:hypothetical protein
MEHADISAAHLIRGIRRHGGDVTVGGNDLNLTATQPLPPDLLAQLRTHKIDLLSYLNAEAVGTIADPAADTSCQSVLAMLAESPDITHTITSDTESEPDAVIVTLAIRGQAKLHMAKDRYDSFTLLELLY